MSSPNIAQRTSSRALQDLRTSSSRCTCRSYSAVEVASFASTAGALCRRDLDARSTHSSRLRDRIAGLAQGIEVERDRLANEPLHLLTRCADDADARQVGAVGTPGLAFVLDD